MKNYLKIDPNFKPKGKWNPDWEKIGKMAEEVRESMSWEEKTDWDNLSLEEKIELLANKVFEN